MDGMLPTGGSTLQSIDAMISIDFVNRRRIVMADIKLKDLRYLIAVADTGHFGKAAERCP